MPDYTSGYTSSVNDANLRQSRDVEMQRMLQLMTQSALDRRQQEEDRQLQIKGIVRGAEQYGTIAPPPSDSGQPPAAAAQAPPMAGPPPQAQPPAPGAPSQPMQMPPPQMMQASMQGPPPPMQPNSNLPPGGVTGMAQDPRVAMAMAQAADRAGKPVDIVQPPPGWKPSPAAPPALGGAPPPGPAPAGAAGPAPAGGIAPPPSAPSGGEGGGMSPAQIINPFKEVAKMIKGGATPEEAGKMAIAMQPIWAAQNKAKIEEFAEQAKIAKQVTDYQTALTRAAREKRLLAKAEAEPTVKPTAFQQELASVYPPGSPEYIAEQKKHIERMDAPSAAQTPLGGGSMMPEAGQGKTGAEFLATLPEKIQNEVKAIAEGRQSIAAMGYRGPQRQQMLELVNQYDPSFDQSIAPARVSTRRDFASGQAARNITSINTAIGHLGTMDELATAMQNKDVRKLNALTNRVATEVGDPRINNFDLAATAVSDEMMRTFRQVGASDTEAARWEKSFKDDLASGQLKGSMQTAVKLLSSRAQALEDQWKNTMGDTVKGPEVIHQRSRDVLKQLGVKMQTTAHDSSHIDNLLDKYAPK